jgi:glycosyltransferase involved in cell wall biosynthesis
LAPSPAKIGILVVAYNAVTTLAKVLDRIPLSFRDRVHEVFVSDDASGDDTYLIGLGYRQRGTDLPLTIVRQPVNLGYGGNQKVGYRHAIEHGWDVVVMLHGDGQYAPECLPDIVEPLLRGEADAVFGSRMMVPGAARRGGMPLYKYAGNRVLTTMQNKVLGTDLSEFHSGYRAYSVKTLAQLPFEQNSDGFNFDTQIIIQLHDAGKRIAEVPIPTYYGDEICYVNGVKYAKDITGDTLRYRLAKMGFGQGTVVSAGAEYGLKPADDSSHGIVTRRLAGEPPSKILDLGCSGGQLAERLRAMGHSVVGVDALRIPGVEDRVDDFHLADLEHGVPAEVGSGYDVIVAGDVLEHVRHPDRLLVDAASRLRPGGVVLASVPNFAHWYPRLRTVAGRFDYDSRGILDRTHYRFFTRRSFLRLARQCDLEVRRVDYTGLPLDVLAGGGGALRRLLSLADRGLVQFRPTLFAYQLVGEFARPNG